MLRKIALGLSVLVLALFIAGIAGYVITGPQAPAADSVSALWLKPGNGCEQGLLWCRRPHACNHTLVSARFRGIASACDPQPRLYQRSQ